MKDRVVVFDDEEERSRDWASHLQKIPGLADRVVCCPSEQLANDLRVLERRRADSRSRRPFERTGTVFDEALVLVVDYDLFGLDKDQVLTGERVAYLARCYSDCGLIVGVNQDLTNRVFDLTLVDHPQAFTDVSVGSEHLCNPGLWGERVDGFRPWQWPYVLEAAEDYERCVELTAAVALDFGVLDLLGIDETHRLMLPRDLRAPILTQGGSRSEQAAASIEGLVRESPLGLRLKDGLWLDEHGTRRTAAARLRKWLEYVVLPRQDVLVDAPHLLRRIPALLPADAWDDTCVPHASAADLGLATPPLAKAQFTTGPWLSRPVWWWLDVANDDELDALRDEVDPSPHTVFCEDVSAFHDRDVCRSFVARVGGPFSQRWVLEPTGADGPVADYEPAVAFAL